MDAITVNSLTKSFTIPHERKNSLVEMLTKPFQKVPVDKLEVLKNISFTVKKGETLGIIGTNGAGKSTLLKLIAGIYTPDAGTIALGGKLVPFLELGVGFNPELTGRENVFLNGIILGMSRSFLKQKFDEIVSFSELERFIDLPLKNYSSGMQVRLAFSIAFMAEADIYLLDEVFSVGDMAFQEKSKTIFKHLKEEGKTLVLVSHSLPTMSENADRLLLLHQGKVQLFDSVAAGIEKYEQLVKQNSN